MIRSGRVTQSEVTASSLRPSISPRNFELLAWLVTDESSADREASVIAISEPLARELGAAALGVPAWKLVARPALSGSAVA